mgnify:FL=1
MNYLYFFLVNILLIICVNYVQHKLNFLLDLSLSHKIKNILKIPLSGGIYILLSLAICNYFYDQEINDNLIVILITFFVLGFYSDTKPNFAPALRLIIQLFLIISFIYFCEIKIEETKIFFIDNFLSNFIFNLIFTSLCIIVLLNGSNFIDGVNNNLVGYFIIVLILISNFNYKFNINFIIIILFTFYLFNFFGKCFLGDNGVYVLSIMMSYIIIDIININSINPIFVINLLWYPAFENLFSIVRRLISDDKIDEADKKHLHSLLYRILFKLEFKKLSNSLTGIIINIFNFFSLYLSLKFLNNNQMLVTILVINIFIYLLTYFKLINILSNRSVSKK